MRNRLYWWLAYLGGACLGMLLLQPSGWYVLFGTWPGRLAIGAVIIAFAIFVCVVSQKDKRELAAHLKQLDVRKVAYRARQTEGRAQRKQHQNPSPQPSAGV